MPIYLCTERISWSDPSIQTMSSSDEDLYEFDAPAPARLSKTAPAAVVGIANNNEQLSLSPCEESDDLILHNEADDITLFCRQLPDALPLSDSAKAALISPDFDPANLLGNLGFEQISKRYVRPS